jgi:hypothetical protein
MKLALLSFGLVVGVHAAFATLSIVSHGFGSVAATFKSLPMTAEAVKERPAT